MGTSLGHGGRQQQDPAPELLKALRTPQQAGLPAVQQTPAGQTAGRTLFPGTSACLLLPQLPGFFWEHRASMEVPGS